VNTRRGLGRGLGALIPTVAEQEARSGTASAAANGVGTLGAPGGADDRTGPAPGHDGARPVGTDAGDAEGHAPGTDGLGEVRGARFAEVPVDAVTPNPRQPREVFEEEAMAELVHSIREIGLLQPVVVRPVGEGRYELIMGERRWRATREAGMDVIPAIVRETSDDALLRDALLENLHRAQLNPLEEAAAYQQLLDDFGCTHEDLAGRIGRSRPQISNTLRLLRLSPPVQRRVAAGVLSAGHARALVGVEDEAAQDRLAGRVVSEGLSVRALEEIVAVGDGTGPGDGAAPRARHRKPVAPGLVELSDRLSERFETRVKVALGKSKGRITVEFASLDDLQRIVDLMDPRTGEEPGADGHREESAQVHGDPAI
jgi:ParB family transcriptional regulator, chromosome partitioning protein